MAFEPHRRRGWPAPFHELQRMQDEISRMQRHGTTAEFPPINIWTGEPGIVLKAEIPGVEPDQLDVTVHDDTLTLKGQRRTPVTADDVTYHRQECADGSFARTIVLPFGVAVDQVEATVEDGVLTLMLPRHEAERPKRIAINHARETGS